MTPFENLLIEKYRPKSLDDIVLSKEDRAYVESLKNKKEIPHLLFVGSPGIGKTALSHIIAKEILDCQSLYLSSTEHSGVDSVRGLISNFCKTKSIDGKLKVIIYDEFELASFDSQKSLLSILEKYADNTRFILTANNRSKIIAPIQSRCQIITLNPQIEGVINRVKQILQNENITISPEQKPLLLKHIKKNLPDIRRIINDIQKFSIGNVLNITSDTSSDFIDEVFQKITNKVDLFVLRKEIIERESCFSNDYHNLLKQLFERFFESNTIDSEKKTECLLTISKGLEMNNLVIDKEINAFTAIINLSKIINN